MGLLEHLPKDATGANVVDPSVTEDNLQHLHALCQLEHNVLAARRARLVANDVSVLFLSLQAVEGPCLATPNVHVLKRFDHDRFASDSVLSLEHCALRAAPEGCGGRLDVIVHVHPSTPTQIHNSRNRLTAGVDCHASNRMRLTTDVRLLTHAKLATPF